MDDGIATNRPAACDLLGPAEQRESRWSYPSSVLGGPSRMGDVADEPVGVDADVILRWWARGHRSSHGGGRHQAKEAFDPCPLPTRGRELSQGEMVEEGSAVVVTVVAAIDGSVASASVLEAARAVAAARHADLEALHVRSPDGYGAIISPAGSLPLRITTGDPVSAIVDASRRDAVAMVVAGVGTRTGAGPGHVAASVLQRLTKPVIIVPAHLARPLAGLPLKVLVAVDGTAATARAAADAACFVGAAELIALHVFSAATAPVYWDRSYHDYPNWCREFVQRYCQGATVRLEFRQGDVAGHILDVAGSGDASLVAMAWSRNLSPGRAGIVTRVLADCPIPVLLFPAPGSGDVESSRPRRRQRGVPMTSGASTAKGPRRSPRRTAAPEHPVLTEGG